MNNPQPNMALCALNAKSKGSQSAREICKLPRSPRRTSYALSRTIPKSKEFGRIPKLRVEDWASEDQGDTLKVPVKTEDTGYAKKI